METMGKSGRAMAMLCLALSVLAPAARSSSEPARVSCLGDPGMRDPRRSRVALEAWNFCNNAATDGDREAQRGGYGDDGLSPALPSPRHADCADLQCPGGDGGHPCTALQRIRPLDNLLRPGDPFPAASFEPFRDPDLYAVEKELYLASLCEVALPPAQPWHFWMIMLKSGNLDLTSGLCPSTFPAHRPLPKPFVSSKTPVAPSFPCFGKGCMNQPLIFHNWSSPGTHGLSGSFYGTYDLNTILKTGNESISFFSVTWKKNPVTASWMFHHTLKVSRKYPWLMLYLRADATKGVSGGYPHETRGMMTKVPESPNFEVIVTLEVTKGGGPQSQFYLLDIGGCWKNNGWPCDGNTASDVTRYSEMIINPETECWCRPSDLSQCPPYHLSVNGTKIHRNDTANFPYSAYHLYCAPANAVFAEKPFHYCDPYSNPQPQELVQLLPHPEWAVHGYPATKGEGWVGDPRTWKLDAGALSSRLYFYQDPGTLPAKRVWPSVDVGTEIYISSQDEVAEWTVSDFDVLI